MKISMPQDGVNDKVTSAETLGQPVPSFLVPECRDKLVHASMPRVLPSEQWGLPLIGGDLQRSPGHRSPWKPLVSDLTAGELDTWALIWTPHWAGGCGAWAARTALCSIRATRGTLGPILHHLCPLFLLGLCLWFPSVQQETICHPLASRRG